MEASGQFKPGTYEASAQGMGGAVTVKVTFSETEITDVVIEGPNETPGYGDKAIAAMPEQVLKAQSADVDGVSGATITSRAVRQAVSDCIAQAKK